MMVKHGFQGFLFIVCINKDVRSSDKRGVWQLFSIQAAIKGDSPFSALFSPFWSTNKQKSDCNGENGDENSENRDQNGESGHIGQNVLIMLLVCRCGSRRVGVLFSVFP